MTVAIPDVSFQVDIPDGPIAIGSDAHKALFCRMLLSTFNPYRPAVIDWPQLDPKTRQIITSLPIWDMAVQTENRAGLFVASFGETIRDVLLKKAVELNAFEERRHRHVLSNLVQAYGIRLLPEPVLAKPKDPEWAFVRVGFSECIDSFFAFGLFEAARRTGMFPPELVDTFEPVIHEEGRHILFFVNWIAWHRRTMAWWHRPWFEFKVLAIWFCLVLERLGMASSVDQGVQDSNFTVNGADRLGVELDPGELMDLCLAENDRRLAAYDPRLLRPTFVPAMVRRIRRFVAASRKS